MSLYGALRVGANALRADQIALQVIGQNIANANTPGYIREEVVLAPAPTQRQGGLMIGLGVEVKAVVQKLDRFLEERLNNAVSDEANQTAQEEVYSNLEGVVGELGDNDISTTMNSFFNSISQILNQPEDVSVRNLAMLQGGTLTDQIVRMANRVTEMRSDANDQVKGMAEEINRLVEEIRRLNVEIANTEGGDISNSDAVGLRDQRLEAIAGLAELIDIRTEEQPSGTVTVYSSSGTYLVFDGTSRPVKVVNSTVDGMEVSDIRVAETDMSLNPSSGQLHGLITARDDILGGFLHNLDTFARTLAFEFNKVYSGGQGLSGYQQVTSESRAADADAALNTSDAGLPYTPVNGSFQVQVIENRTGLTHTSTISVKLTGTRTDTTLNDLADQLGNVPGLTAAISPDGKLTIQSSSADQSFAFANDTSGVLAALGINTFFTGDSARSLGVNQVVQEDPGKFVASRTGVGLDTAVAVDLAGFLDRPLTTQNGTTIGVLYNRMVSEVTQGSAIARAAATGARVYKSTLAGQKMATSGVSLDEEALKLIAYQRAFQATARYIKAASDMLEMLTNL